jgi:hypothetical protein
MSGRIPSYGEYERKGTGGPEGTCRACGHQGPMDHGMTGYECARCHSPDLVLKLKGGGLYHQLRKQVEPAGASDDKVTR